MSFVAISSRASNCMTADAYATTFQAMGINTVKEFLKAHPELKVFLFLKTVKTNWKLYL